ncbi:hypothetical protein HII31_01771 [Pseudocercospora fuligena]|uniref:Uncharacterized protein n=1 Tax=Pseudocercospora fuligena TaxID=685502 RepID=A0A8H6RTY7_9PEZI|nr:hypothetical protein HII31_01771 [Pseudocercospora fuligena]
MTSKLDHKRSAAAAPRSPSASYRDDPDAVSLRTTRSDYDYDDVPELPAYDDVMSNTAAEPASTEPPAQYNYRSIAQPKQAWRSGNKQCSSAVSIGSETSIRMDEQLMHADKLYDYITNYLRVVSPRPMIRINGYHMEMVRKSHTDNKKEKQRVTDFDIVLGLEEFLPKYQEQGWWDSVTVDGGIKTYRGGFRKARAEGFKQDIEVGNTAEQRDLKAWCEDFCDNKSALKVFRVQRNVEGLDTDLIKERLEPVIRSTHYRGHVDITFPVADRNVDIYSPHWVNKARISWVRWIFYLTFLWVFTWPVLFFMTKKWNVYMIHWRFSRPSQTQVGAKEYASISESAWIQRHSQLILSLVLDKYQGDGTQLPTDVQVDPNSRRPEINVPTVNLAGGGLNAAVSLFNGGMSVYRQASGQGNQGWGADQC